MATNNAPGMVAASMGGSMPVMAATAGVAAAAAVAIGRRGLSGAQAMRRATSAVSRRTFSSKVVRSPAGELHSTKTNNKVPPPTGMASKAPKAMPFEVVPPHALKADKPAAVPTESKASVCVIFLLCNSYKSDFQTPKY